VNHFNAVSQPYPHIDAVKKVTGTVEFLSDMRLPRMLWAKIVRSSRPHALLKRIDTERARRLPGVHSVVTAEDIRHIPCGPFVPDWEVLARHKVRFVGQEVAVVIAESRDAAEEAARLVEVVYEDLPAVFDPVAAMSEGAPVIHESSPGNVARTFSVERGDVDEALARSDFVREETFYASSAFHAYLEPAGCVARYDPTSGEYTIWAATQVPYKAQLLYSYGLGIPRDKLRLIQVPMGGAFGGKFESNIHMVALAASASVPGRPVRLVNTMAEEFFNVPLRVPMKIHLRMGLSRDGLITSRESTVIADNGGRTSYGPAVLATACYRVDSLYRIENIRARGFLVYTNNQPKGAMRGFGNPQALFAVEAMIDMLAEDAGLDPGDVRIRNSFSDGDVSAHGWVINSCGLADCIRKAQAESGWSEFRSNHSGSGPVLRGLGLACCNHVSGYRPILREFDGSSAVVKVSPSGTITVFSGEVDFGQGYRTVAAQCAAEKLGVPLEWVEVAPVDSSSSVLGIGSLASRGTVMGGNAVLKASEDLYQKLLCAAAGHFGHNKDSIALRAGAFIDITTGETLGRFREVISSLTDAQAGQPFVGVGHYTPDTVIPDPKTQYGNPSPTYSFGAHVAEVSVDTRTGQVTVTRYYAFNDAGKIINPLLAAGQLEGGVVQGIGWALLEELVCDEGDIVNNSLLDYKIPTIADAPTITTGFVEALDPNGPFGAKSLGEPAFNPVAAAVCNAIYDATGVRVRKLPVTPEYMLELLKQRGGGSESAMANNHKAVKRR
jgi:CO/xanthine dehydrogenase Mo-binding subunit